MKLIEETTQQSEKTFKPFNITLQIESPEDIAWLYGVSNLTVDYWKTTFSDMGESPDNYNAPYASQMQLFELAQRLYKNLKAGKYHE